jgi:hypothetical protein
VTVLSSAAILGLPSLQPPASTVYASGRYRLPNVLARYIAASAARIIASACWPLSEPSAMPTLALAPITLRRGITGDRSLWEWRKHVADGQIDRRSGSIILMTADGKDVARWTFANGWPSKWEGPALNGQSNYVAIETLRIVHEGFDWVA